MSYTFRVSLTDVSLTLPGRNSRLNTAASALVTTRSDKSDCVTDFDVMHRFWSQFADLPLPPLPASASSATTHNHRLQPRWESVLHFYFDGMEKEVPIELQRQRPPSSPRSMSPISAASASPSSSTPGRAGLKNNGHHSLNAETATGVESQLTAVSATNTFFSYSIHAKSVEDLARSLSNRFAAVHVLLRRSLCLLPLADGASDVGMDAAPVPAIDVPHRNNTRSRGAATTAAAYDSGSAPRDVLVLASATVSLLDLAVSQDDRYFFHVFTSSSSDTANAEDRDRLVQSRRTQLRGDVALHLRMDEESEVSVAPRLVCLRGALPADVSYSLRYGWRPNKALALGTRRKREQASTSRETSLSRPSTIMDTSGRGHRKASLGEPEELCVRFCEDQLPTLQLTCSRNALSKQHMYFNVLANTPSDSPRSRSSSPPTKADDRECTESTVAIGELAFNRFVVAAHHGSEIEAAFTVKCEGVSASNSTSSRAELTWCILEGAVIIRDIPAVVYPLERAAVALRIETARETAESAALASAHQSKQSKAASLSLAAAIGTAAGNGTAKAGKDSSFLLSSVNGEPLHTPVQTLQNYQDRYIEPRGSPIGLPPLSPPSSPLSSPSFGSGGRQFRQEPPYVPSPRSLAASASAAESVAQPPQPATPPISERCEEKALSADLQQRRTASHTRPATQRTETVAGDMEAPVPLNASDTSRGPLKATTGPLNPRSRRSGSDRSSDRITDTSLVLSVYTGNDAPGAPPPGRPAETTLKLPSTIGDVSRASKSTVPKSTRAPIPTDAHRGDRCSANGRGSIAAGDTSLMRRSRSLDPELVLRFDSDAEGDEDTCSEVSKEEPISLQLLDKSKQGASRNNRVKATCLHGGSTTSVKSHARSPGSARSNGYLRRTAHTPAHSVASGMRTPPLAPPPPPEWMEAPPPPPVAQHLKFQPQLALVSYAAEAQPRYIYAMQLSAQYRILLSLYAQQLRRVEAAEERARLAAQRLQVHRQHHSVSQSGYPGKQRQRDDSTRDAPGRSQLLERGQRTKERAGRAAATWHDRIAALQQQLGEQQASRRDQQESMLKRDENLAATEAELQLLIRHLFSERLNIKTPQSSPKPDSAEACTTKSENPAAAPATVSKTGDAQTEKEAASETLPVQNQQQETPVVDAADNATDENVVQPEDAKESNDTTAPSQQQQLSEGRRLFLSLSAPYPSTSEIEAKSATDGEMKALSPAEVVEVTSPESAGQNSKMPSGAATRASPLPQFQTSAPIHCQAASNIHDATSSEARRSTNSLLSSLVVSSPCPAFSPQAASSPQLHDPIFTPVDSLSRIEEETLLDGVDKGDRALVMHLLHTKPSLFFANNNLLHLACAATLPDVSVVEALLAIRPELIHGIDTHTGNSVLHVACAARYPCARLVKHLIVSGATTELRNKMGLSPFHVAVLNAGDSTRHRVKDTLLALGNCNVNERTDDGRTALHLVCRTNTYMTVLRYLLLRGADAAAKAPCPDPLTGKMELMTPLQFCRAYHANATAQVLEICSSASQFDMSR